MNAKDLRIISLTAENVKRLTAVTIRPDGAAVVVAGENEAGKSSVLDSIAYALGGEKLVPAQPVRKGQAKAKVSVDLGDYLVTRTFTATGGGNLTVTNREGAKFPSPQALLDGLVGSLAFDPLAFASAKPADQAATLRQLVRLDVSDLDTARKEAYDARTVATRELKTIDARLAGVTRPRPDELIAASDAALLAELDAADAKAAKAARLAQLATVAESKRAAAADRVTRALRAVETAQRALEAAEAELETAEGALGIAGDAVQAADLAATHAAENVPDRTELRATLAAMHAKQATVAERKRHAAEFDARDRKAAEIESLAATINNCDTAKAERLAACAFPVEGLSLDGDVVTWQGLPLAQASTAIRTRVSVAIGLALNAARPLKLALIRNGNDLDAKNLAAIAAQVDEAGGQVWIERIAGGDGIQTIVIENGEVIQ